MSIHLYNTKEVAETRKKLYEEQGGIDKLTGIPLEYKDSVTDHDHKTQYVRGIIHRQVNAVVGKVENMYIRYIKWWCSIPLPELLRKIADYLELPQDKRYVHPSWLKACQSKFNALDEKSKAAVLKDMALHDGKNGKERKEIFRKGLLSRRYTLTQIENILRKEVKDGK